MERCFDHAGTYFGVLAMITNEGDHLRIIAGEVDQGFKSVVLNGQTLSASSQSSSSCTVRLLSVHSLLVTVGLYSLLVENVDRYVDLVEVQVSSWETLVDERKPEGLLGRTWNATMGAPVDDLEVEQYREKDDNILGCNTDRDKFCPHISVDRLT